MKKFLAIILALVLVLSFGAMAFAAYDSVRGPSVGDEDDDDLVVQFITGERRTVAPITAPYEEMEQAAITLADKTVMSMETAFDVLSGDAALVDAIRAFFDSHPDRIAEGVITLGEDAVPDSSVLLAVDARGYDKVMFTASGDAEDLPYVVLRGQKEELEEVAEDDEKDTDGYFVPVERWFPSPSRSDIEWMYVPGTSTGEDDSSDDGAGQLIVKFYTDEIRIAVPISAPYSEKGDAAVALADKVVMYKDEALATLTGDIVEGLKLFYAENPDSIFEGVITLGEDTVEDGSVTLAVEARGYDKVMFTAPGDAYELGFVIIERWVPKTELDD